MKINYSTKVYKIILRNLDSHAINVSYLSICNFEDCGLDEIMSISEYLSQEEQEYYNSLQYERRIRSYLMGRYAAKLAVSKLIHEKDLKKISIGFGIHYFPIVAYQHTKNIQVSITHSNSFAACIAFTENCPLGLDVEKMNEENRNSLISILNKEEIVKLRESGLDELSSVFLAWTSKEALSKVIKTGLTIPVHYLELKDIRKEMHCITGGYENFIQYQFSSYVIKNHILSITYSKKCKLEFDYLEIVNAFDRKERRVTHEGI